MDKKLKLAYSTCPNDTFIFYALAHNVIDCKGPKFEIELADVETLNQHARAGVYDISKLSFAAIGHLVEEYGLLRSGAALGRGCGPLLVAKPGFGIEQLSSTKIAVPGMWTTACMLLGLYLSKNYEAVPMPFEKIMPAIQNDKYECGVIIHEGRFTYEEYGLVRVIDLGEWWEKKTSLPVPLGGIAVRRDITSSITGRMEDLIRSSVEYSFNHRNEAVNYIKKYAQEMSSEAIRQHIDLYVNDFTLNLGKAGEEAVNTLFRMARDSKMIPESKFPLFINP
ncbi:MAG: 1,4-dihydroxy-6-naphthoate synthase [Deltaproteobacteria bacterium]|nr:1,4-dihydroxy-6-naphthoate synthase [Deltaproteobacteria bacterium]